MDGADNRLLVEGRVNGKAGSLDQPLASRWPQHLGWFKSYFDDGRWVWSPQVERMHGYRPGTVAPRTALVLSHIHPGDVTHVAAALDDVRRTPATFSSRHRIVDAHFRVHDVVLVGSPFYDTSGALLGIHGCYLDVTPAVPSDILGSQDNYERLAHCLRVTTADGHSDDRRHRIRASTRC